MTDFMLSLASNPFDPFTEYDEWWKFDRREGFDTAGLLARALSTSEALPEGVQEHDLEETIDSIVNNPHFGGLYKKVERRTD